MINEYFKKHENFTDSAIGLYKSLAPLVTCKDGFNMSVQASTSHYCKPRVNKAYYTHVEVGYPSEREESLMPYAEDESNPTETVYGYVPIEIVEKIIEKHGGLDEN